MCLLCVNAYAYALLSSPCLFLLPSPLAVTAAAVGGVDVHDLPHDLDDDLARRRLPDASRANELPQSQS